jgi:hypothetical protein
MDDEQATIRPARDFDFHPEEADVRVFAAEPGGVLRPASVPTADLQSFPMT